MIGLVGLIGVGLLGYIAFLIFPIWYVLGCMTAGIILALNQRQH